MARPQMRGPGGRRGMMGGKRSKNPKKTLGRLMKYIQKGYGVQFVVVLICILLSAVANVAGSMFLKSLIDDYISPLLLQASPVFTGLLHAFVPAALVLSAVHACIAARADMRHVLRQIKFVQRAARKQAVEHHLCNAVGGRFGFPFVRIEYGYVHSEHPFLCGTNDRIRDFRFVGEHCSPLRLHMCR